MMPRLRKLQTVLFFLLISLSIVFFYNAKTANSQDFGPTEFGRSYDEYKSKQDFYSKTRDQYILSRDQYLAYKTLTAKTSAQNDTANFLEARDEVLEYYFRALKARVNETKGIPDEGKNDIFTKLDAEIQWFADHKVKPTPYTSLTDLVIISNESRDHLNTLNPLIYNSLYSISDGRILDYRQRLGDLLARTKTKTDSIKNEQREGYKFSQAKIDNIDRWISETDAKLSESDSGYQANLKIVARIRNYSSYMQAIQQLDNVRLSLKSGAIYIGEIVGLIKTAE